MRVVSGVGFARGLLVLSLFLSGCSTNPATGRSQFDAFMPASSEAAIGAQQHEQILAQYGGVYQDAALRAYVEKVGQEVARNTERRDIQYRFTLLDSPVVNAFALPGGYVYVTRGILAVANDEAELAGVLGHEIGHITARHQASRYSQGVLTTLGATLIGAAVGDANVTRALGVGNNLYMSSYSRDQETEADMLGIRYVNRAGMDTMAVSDFLNGMDTYVSTENRIAGKNEADFSYFSSHPQTGGRVAKAAQEAGRYQAQPERRANAFLSAIDGMTYGDSAEQGFVRGRNFFHPGLGFTFTAPDGYAISNQPDKIALAGRDGAIMLLDLVGNRARLSPLDYLVQDWMKGERMNRPEAITINGLDAATDSFPGTLNGRPVDIRVIAIAWAPDRVFRFQIAIPRGASGGTLEGLKRASYSFRRMTSAEKASVRPQRLRVVMAKPGDTVDSLSAQMQVEAGARERFLALNGNRKVVAGQRYKIVVN